MLIAILALNYGMGFAPQEDPVNFNDSTIDRAMNHKLRRRRRCMMKRFYALLSVVAFLTIGISTFAIDAQAALYSGQNYSGAWEPTDSSVFAIQFDYGGSASDSFYMYDYGNQFNSLELFTSSGYNFDTVYFQEDQYGIWYADTTAGGTSLILGSDPLFGFYFSDGNTVWDEYALYGPLSGAYELFDINTNMHVFVHDAVPTPIPSTAILLGAGLVGIIRLRMYMHNNPGE